MGVPDTDGKTLRDLHNSDRHFEIVEKYGHRCLGRETKTAARFFENSSSKKAVTKFGEIQTFSSGVSSAALKFFRCEGLGISPERLKSQ